MRRHRRSLLIDRLIPFLAAGIGLIALAGAVLVQMNTQARTQAITTELVALKTEVQKLSARADEIAAAQDDGTAAGLLALQDRMASLEGKIEETSVAAGPSDAAAGGTETAIAAAAPAAIDPSLPTTDCIPLGTRFVVVPNESYPLCQSKAVVKVSAINDGSVIVDGAGPIVATGFGKLIGTDCTIMVFSADVAGFAEMRVSCT